MQRDLSCPVLWQESLRASQERRIQSARRETRERVGRRSTVAALCGLAVLTGGAFAHDGGAPEGSAATAAEGSAATTVYLESGDSGAQVRDVQQALEISVDGVYGPQTERSVRSFQERNGLQVDGIAGPVTMRALGLGGGAGASEGASSGGEGTTTPSEESAEEPAATEEPEAEEPEAEEPAAEEPAVEEPADEEPAPDEVEEPAAEEPVAEEPVAEEPVAEEPVAEEPAAEEPSSDLQAIAQCESGGDAGAVSSNGEYRGKYQFSRETWRGVGGEGDPAAATEAEQDRRAAGLYEQSGSAPWPTCG
ncbi:MAG: transglycosylase family protein [Solirubrobacteraceae bacterium]